MPAVRELRGGAGGRGVRGVAVGAPAAAGGAHHAGAVLPVRAQPALPRARAQRQPALPRQGHTRSRTHNLPISSPKTAI